MATFITSKAVGQTISIRVYSTIGYWKYNHNGVDSNPYPNQHQDVSISVTNSNGEFTLFSCDSQGNISGEINSITLYSGYGNPSNQITSFDGSGLSSSLTYLDLSSNLLTSFSGTGLSGLTNLHLYNNLLTSFSGVGLVNLTSLELNKNNLTSFNGTGLSSLVMLYIEDNNLTSFNGTGMNNLTGLYITGNSISTFTPSSITRSSNDSILSFLNSNNISNGVLYTYGGRTTTSTSNYNSLISKGWSLYGVDLPLIPTFITSKSVGESFTISGYNVPFSNNRKSIQTTTGYWKYYHNGVYSNVFGDSYSNTSQTITVANSNGEFKFISCDSSGTPSGNITHLILPSCQITSFDGSDLTGLITLELMSNSISSFNNLVLPSSLGYLGLTNNPLTSFNGTGLVNLNELQINACSLTSFNGTDLGNLTILGLQYNQLTSINLTGLTSLVNLGLKGNQLTSLDISGLTNLNALYISENPITRSINDSILDVLNSNNVNGGTLLSENGRTSAGTSDYNSLISRGWSLTGVDLPPMVTLTTSKTVGETIKIDVYTTGGYWKYNHNGIDSSLYQDGSQTITVSNANGQFSITAYNSQGNISGNILNLNFENNLVSNQITSIDVTSLTGLTGLNLSNNLLTSFNSTGLSNLTSLNLSINQLTSFSGTGLSSLTTLDLSTNQLTSFNGTGMSNLTTLELPDNLINSFNNGNMTSLNVLSLVGNQLTSFDARSLSNLTSLTLGSNLLTSFNGTGLSNLVTLGLQFNQLTSIDTTGLTSLRNFSLRNNQISSFIGIESLNGLNGLYIFNNPITTSINNSILNKINSNNINGGSFTSVNGRTSEGTTAYNSLISRGWTLIDLDLVIPPPTPVPTRVGIRGNWGGSIWNEPSEPDDYTPNPISENGNWNGGSNGTSGSGGTI